MKYFKILKNFYNSSKNFPDPEEFPIHLRPHTRNLVCGLDCNNTEILPYRWKIFTIFQDFPGFAWKILENRENFSVLFHVFLMYLKFSKPQTQDLVC
jgi:hypothetical protein